MATLMQTIGGMMPSRIASILRGNFYVRLQAPSRERVVRAKLPERSNRTTPSTTRGTELAPPVGGETASGGFAAPERSHICP